MKINANKKKSTIGSPYTVIYSGGRKMINPDVEGNVLREIRKYKHTPQIERILAEKNLEVLSKLEKDEMTIHEAENVIYNSIVGSFVEENKCSELCVELIYGWGMQLEDWEVFNPKDIPEAITAMRAISYAILDRETFIKSVFEKDKINYYEAEIVSFLGDRGLNSVLIKALENEDIETVERAIISLRRLNNEKYADGQNYYKSRNMEFFR